MNQPTNDREYRTLMARIDTFLEKTKAGGFAALTPEETDEVAQLALLAQAYEDSIPMMPIAAPRSLPQMLQFKMYEQNLKQRELASLLEIPETRLSEVLRGKRPVSMELAKKLRTKLGIDASFILDHA